MPSHTASFSSIVPETPTPKTPPSPLKLSIIGLDKPLNAVAHSTSAAYSSSLACSPNKPASYPQAYPFDTSPSDSREETPLAQAPVAIQVHHRHSENTLSLGNIFFNLWMRIKLATSGVFQVDARPTPGAIRDPHAPRNDSCYGNTVDITAQTPAAGNTQRTLAEAQSAAGTGLVPMMTINVKGAVSQTDIALSQAQNATIVLANATAGTLASPAAPLTKKAKAEGVVSGQTATLQGAQGSAYVIAGARSCLEGYLLG